VKIEVFPDTNSLAKAASAKAAAKLRDCIQQTGRARIIAATGAAQFEFLEVLTRTPQIDWSRVEMFHLDEYIGIPAEHPASFRKFLRERLINKTGITHHHLINGDADSGDVIVKLTAEIRKAPIDLAFVGIGENGHLAFNDPPADFETDEAYIVVELDEACRRQQMGEGWFKSLDEVPRRAISMTVRQILKAQEIIAIVPEARKAKAIEKCFAGEISPLAPASVLRRHSNTIVYLDKDSAALLKPETVAAFQP
jgi:glucosamine-6-phosphate deaminase